MTLEELNSIIHIVILDYPIKELIMRTKKNVRKSWIIRLGRKIYRNPRRYLIQGVVLIGILTVILIIRGFYGKKDPSVPKKESVKVVMMVDDTKPVILDGYKGIISGVMVAEATSSPYYALGTSLEEVLVGQRKREREDRYPDGIGTEVAESVNDIDEQSWKLIEDTKMSDGDYETLLAIVEAESGGEDVKGRILVANVILNRVESDLFPGNVTDVVWENTGGSPQFSPTVDGRINTVEISDITREAVNRAIDGEDYSEGALFFLEKATSEEKNVTWFDENLNFLFQHGVHSFYKY